MDPARMAELQEYLTTSNQHMDRQEQQVSATAQAVQALVVQVSELTTQIQQLRSPAVPTPPNPINITSQHKPKIPTPERYAGEPELCRAFLTRCSLFFSLHFNIFHQEIQSGVGVCLPQSLSTNRSSLAVGRRQLSGGAALEKSSSVTLLPGRLQWAYRLLQWPSPDGFRSGG